jgi:hypothetical protein
MIIRIDSTTTDDATAARHDLDELARDWGHELTDQARPYHSAAGDTDKVIDPVALASLVLSIPSAALAVADIGDRIHKRRRARHLIDHAQQLANHLTTITLLTPDGARELAHLDPDQLLDLFATDDPSTPPDN